MWLVPRARHWLSMRNRERLDAGALMSHLDFATFVPTKGRAA
jgi:hypothetical protein